MSTQFKKCYNRKIETTRQHLLYKCWDVLYNYIPTIENCILKSNRDKNFDWKIYLQEIDTNIKQICKSHNILENQKPYNYLSSHINHARKMNTSREIVNNLQLLINVITANYNRRV